MSTHPLETVLQHLDEHVPARMEQVGNESMETLSEQGPVAIDTIAHYADTIWSADKKSDPSKEAILDALVFTAAIHSHRENGVILGDRHWCANPEDCTTCRDGVPEFPFEWVEIDDRKSGAHFTPRVMAQEIVENTLAGVVKDPGPVNEPDPEKWKTRDFDKLWPVRVCDPAVGAGAFLVAAARYLIPIVHEAIPFRVDVFYPACTVLEHSLYGVDLNPWSVHLTRAVLGLMVPGVAMPGLEKHIIHGDALIGAIKPDDVPAEFDAKFPGRPLVHWRERFPEVFGV